MRINSAPGRWCCKTLFGSLKAIFPDRRRGDRIFVRGTNSTSDKLTGNLGIAFEDTAIGDCCLAALFAEKSLKIILECCNTIGTFETCRRAVTTFALARITDVPCKQGHFRI